MNRTVRASLTTTVLTTLTAALLGGCAVNPGLGGDSAPQQAAEANFKLGVGYLQRGQFALAREKLNKALDFDPDLAEAHNALGVLYEQARNGRDAEYHFEQAVAKNEDYILARLNYARVLCANGKAELGEAQFLTVTETPDSYRAQEIPFTGAGVCARLRRDLETAERYLRRALEFNPNAPGTLLELASISVERQRYQEARELLQRYHRQVGYSTVSLHLAIQVEDQIGDKDLSEEYRRLLASQTKPNV